MITALIKKSDNFQWHYFETFPTNIVIVNAKIPFHPKLVSFLTLHLENFDIYLCILFYLYYQSLISRRKTEHLPPLKSNIFLIFANLLKILSLKLQGNLSCNSYTKFVILDMKFCFTCRKWDLHEIIIEFQNISTKIVLKFLFCFLHFQLWFKFMKNVLMWLKEVNSIKRLPKKQSRKLSKVKFA